MALPHDINNRVRSALKAGYAPEAIQADIKRKYGADVSVHPLSGLDKAANVSNKFLSTLGGLTGIDKGGESLARLGLQLGHQMGKVAGIDTDQTLQAPAATGKQIAGDILRVGGTAANLAAAPASTGGRILANTAAGTALGTGNDLIQGKSVGQSLEGGAVRGTIAGGTTAALAGLGWLFNKLTGDVPAAAYKMSTRVPNKTDTELLLKEGITGNREQLAQKAERLVNEAGEAIRANPTAQGAQISGDDIWNYAPLQDLRKQAQRLGEGDAVDRAILKVMPKPTGAPQAALENAPDSLQALRDQIDELAGTIQRPGTPPPNINELKAQFANLEKQNVLRSNSTPLLDALQQKTAIDRASGPSVFTDRATAMGSRAQNSVADAIRNLTAEKAPQVTDQLQRQAAALTLLRTLQDYETAKASPVPYSLGNIAQRTLFTPGIATPIASAAYKTGAPFRAAQSSGLVTAIKRALERAGVAKLGNF